MSIKTKSMIGILTVIMFHFFIIHLIQIFIIGPRFEKHSIDVAARVMKKNIDLLETERDALINLTRDYAVWNDTYEYVIDKNEKYINDNYYETGLSNLGLCFVMIIDKNGEVLFGKYKNVENKWININRNCLYEFIRLKDIQDNFYSFFNMDGEIVVVVAQKILKTDASGISNGLVVFAKKLYDFKMFNENTISFIPLDNLDKDEFERIRSMFYSDEFLKVNYKDNIFVIKEESKDYITVYMNIKNIIGEPIGFLKVNSSREIENFGKSVCKMLMYSFAILGLIAILALNIGFNILVGKPIEKIKRNMDIFKKCMKNVKNQEFYNRDDEISDLARGIDEFKEEIILRHNELIEINKNLEIKVHERTMELEEKNKELVLSDKIISEALEGVIVCDVYKNIIKINKAVENITGYFKDELLDKKIDILNLTLEDTRGIDEILNYVLDCGCFKGELYGIDKYNKKIPFLSSIISLKHRDEVYFIIILTDITEIKNAEEKLRQMAYYDLLTSLPNRALFYENLNKSIKRAKRNNSKVAVLFLDIDRFKIVNDTLGHEKGDKLLVAVSKRLKENIRDTDVVCRLGGDEFTIILEDINDESSIAHIANNLIKKISQPFYIEDNEIKIGLSIGIAIYPTDDTTIEGLVRKADSALYEAKESERGTFRFFSQDIEEKYLNYVEIDNGLKKALNENEFRLYIQPIYKKVDNGYTICKAELLIRWVTKEGKLYTPDKFIPIAESNGMIVPIGRWVIDEACRISNKLKENGVDIGLCINISINQFQNKNFISELHERANKDSNIYEKIMFEITENVLANNMDLIREILLTVKKFGIEIALDDFGTGYSSINYISQLPIDYIKVDKIFTSQIQNQEKRALVNAIKSMATTLKIKTIAEGVETIEQLNLLQEIGFDEFQGYYFCKPISLEEFIQRYDTLLYKD